MDESVSKAELAQRLGIARSSLYYRAVRPAADEALRIRIEAVMRQHPGYGHRRIADALGINRKRVRRVMKKYNLKPARRCRSIPEKPGDRGREDAGFIDVTRFLCPVAPGVVWTADFTFVSFHGSFVYLAAVKDLFTREVVGFAVMTTHAAELVVRAFLNAIEAGYVAPRWFHSDQGSEYMSEELQALLHKHDVMISTTPKAAPWRNGSQESFFGRFKVEFGDPERFETLGELVEAICQYVHYYNCERIHTALRCAPVEYRQRWLQECEKFRSNDILKSQAPLKGGLTGADTLPAVPSPDYRIGV
jgi:transposase InsO family protein